MRFSSGPPTAALFLWGGGGEIEMLRLKISSEIKIFDRDRKFRARLKFFDRWALWGGIPGDRGLFKGGGNGRGGGAHTPVRGTMFVCNGAVTPGPSCECDITFFVKGRPKSARQPRDSTVVARSVLSVTVPSSRVSREYLYPGLRSPPLKMPDESS